MAFKRSSMKVLSLLSLFKIKVCLEDKLRESISNLTSSNNEAELGTLIMVPKVISFISSFCLDNF